MPTITVPFHKDNAVRFHVGIMSDAARGIAVSQSLRGDELLIRWRDNTYRVNVEDIAIAVLEEVRATEGGS